MYWTNFCQPTNSVKQNIFEQTLIKDVSLSLCASFGTFCIQIGPLFESQWPFKHSEEFRNRVHFTSMTVNCRFSDILQRLTVSPKIDQFWGKRCQNILFYMNGRRSKFVQYIRIRMLWSGRFILIESGCIIRNNKIAQRRHSR